MILSTEALPAKNLSVIQTVAVEVIERYQRNIRFGGGTPNTSEVVKKAVVNRGIKDGVKQFVLFESKRYPGSWVKGLVFGIVEGALLFASPQTSQVVTNMQKDADDYGDESLNDPDDNSHLNGAPNSSSTAQSQK